MKSFRFNEKYLSQIPALQQLIALGFKYLTPDEAVAERQGRFSNVLLEEILRKQLKEINHIQYRGREYLFSEENVQTAIQKLKNITWDGPHKTNEAVYDLLTLGTALEQSVEGDTKSFTLRYIDWKNWDNNVFHVTAEFSVERTRSDETARPDIVLFVNGIPFTVIECKSPNIEVDKAVEQGIRNQNDENFSKLIQQAIDEYRAKRISDLEYLKKVTAIRNKVVTREHDDVPVKLDKNEDAQAFYGVLKPYFKVHALDAKVCEEVSADAALAIQDILKRNWKVHFWDDADAQKRTINDIDDFLYDEIKGTRGIELTTGQMDEIIERSMQLARHRTSL